MIIGKRGMHYSPRITTVILSIAQSYVRLGWRSERGNSPHDSFEWTASEAMEIATAMVLGHDLHKEYKEGYTDPVPWGSLLVAQDEGDYDETALSVDWYDYSQESTIAWFDRAIQLARHS